MRLVGSPFDFQQLRLEQLYLVHDTIGRGYEVLYKGYLESWSRTLMDRRAVVEGARYPKATGFDRSGSG
jgi:hypothetical protein